MAATARMILQVDPAEKARWTVEAHKAGISTSEFVRRAAAEHDPELIITPQEAEILRVMTAEVNAAAARMAANLDSISATVREIIADLNDPVRDAEIRAQVRAEFAASGMKFDFSRLRDIAA